MESVVQSFATLVIAVGVIFFFGPILVIASLIGLLELGPVKIDLRPYSKIIRAVVGLLGLAIWLSIYVPIVSILPRLISTTPPTIGVAFTPTPTTNSTVAPTSNLLPAPGVPMTVVLTPILTSTITMPPLVIATPPATPTSTSAPTVPPIPSATETRLEGATSAPVGSTTPVPVPTGMGYGFETGVEGWGTSEGDFKIAQLDTVRDVVHTGAQALRLTMELFGENSQPFVEKESNPVYQHTEAVAYFNAGAGVPVGSNSAGPYNLEGRRVACFVYLPETLATGDSRPASVRIFVKDTGFANHLGPAITIDQATVQQWFELSLNVGVPAPDDDLGGDFNPQQVNALGIRIDTPPGSTLAYVGPVYIDTCTLQYP